MRELYELKEMLCRELKEYGSKGELTAGSLDVVDKLTHSIKNLNKIIEAYEEEEYSNADTPGNSYRGYPRENSYRRSYARGRSNAKRDSMGRYSRDDGMIQELRDLMQNAPNETIKSDIQRVIDKLEQM